MSKKQANPKYKPQVPMPEGATHHDGRWWYKDKGWRYWSDPYGVGFNWHPCHWGAMNPLDHMWAVDVPPMDEPNDE